jgi:myo-inositol-hexaphosphate 3-phosphohydrolase
MALATLPDTTPVLIVSSQGANRFFVYERNSPYKFRGAFSIAGARGTDGIDLIQSNVFTRFEGGIFGCHTDEQGHPILLTSWSLIVKTFAENVDK